jgi:glycosyltransferase involved in cell wall biosynthesis
MKKLSIIVPVYFNEGSLPHLYDALTTLEKMLLERQVELELILVDDGSKDGSYAALKAIQAKRPATRVIKLARNFGAYHAIKAGLGLVTGDCFTYLAADLQDPPELLIEMVDRWKNGSKYVVCTRSDRHDPPTSKFFAKFYYKLLRTMVLKDYPAGGFDLALMDRVMLPYLLSSGRNINLALFAYWLGFKPDFIPYERRERKHGKSRWTFSKKFTLFLDSLLGFSIIPIRTISFLGVVVSLLSFGYGVVVVINALMGKIPIKGFSATIALTSFLLGLVILMLGIIGEYVWRIHTEVNNRPEFVIEDIS